MNQKKIITLILLTGLLFPNNLALSAGTLKASVSDYKFDYVNLDWWKDYNDKYLEGYIVKAIKENQDLNIATLKVEEANQQMKLQLSKEFPSAAIGASPAVLKNMGATNTEGLLSFPLLVNYEADIFLKNRDKTNSSKKLYETSKLYEKAAYISIVSAIGSTYFNLVRQDKIISIQNEIIATRKQIYELTKESNKDGLTSTVDLVRANKDLIMATADLKDLEKTRTILLNSLAVLTGESPNNIQEFKRISYEELPEQKLIPAEISSKVITQRPDYLAAEKNVEKAGLDVKIAKKEFLPDISIMGLLMFNSTSISSSLNWKNALAGVGGAALLPIFSGGAKFANLRLSKNKYEQVLKNYYKTNLIAIQEVNDSLSTLKLDDEKYKKNLSAQDMQKKDYDYTQSKYNLGLISMLDLVQQKEALLVINKMTAESKTNCYIDRIGLYKAAGGKV